MVIAFYLSGYPPFSNQLLCGPASESEMIVVVDFSVQVSVLARLRRVQFSSIGTS